MTPDDLERHWVAARHRARLQRAVEAAEQQLFGLRPQLAMSGMAKNSAVRPS
jgi:hypothetical protein